MDALYFTQLNSNKRSLAINTKTPEGHPVMEQLIRGADVLVENFAPGAMDRMGLSWEHLQELNPRLVYGSIKGFNDDSPWKDLKVYDNVAQAAGGACSTTGFWDGPPTVSGAALGDSNTGMHLAIGILTALLGREKTGLGQRISVSMQDAVLNLCRVKLRDQERLERLGYLEEYPQYPNGTFTDTVPRGGNAGGGGQPGWTLKCNGWETDPNAYIYFTLQEQDWGPTCQAIGKPEWADDPAYITAEARQPHIFDIFAEIEKWLADKTKYEAVDIVRKYEVPCGPVLSMKGWCFVVNAVSFGFVIVSLLSLDTRRLHPVPPVPRGRGQLRAGLRYAAGVPAIIRPLLMMALIGTFTFEFEVSLPLLAETTFHGTSTTYSALIGALGAGAVAGGLYMARSARTGVARLIRAALGYAIAVGLVAVAPTLATAIAACVLAGVASVIFLTTGNATIQLASDPEYRGRVTALWSMALVGSTPIGSPVIGALSDIAGPRSALALGAAACLAAAIIGRWPTRSALEVTQ